MESDKGYKDSKSSLDEDSENRDWLSLNAGKIIDNIDSNTKADSGAPEVAGDHSWPWRGLIAGAVILLLAAGIYALIARYSTMQKEITSLRMSMVAGDNFKQQRDQLQQDVDTLIVVNQTLRDQVDRLRNQLEVDGLYRQLREPESGTEVTQHQAIVVKTVPDSETKVSSGGWFVNFGSYYNRDIAEKWSQRLDPAAGEVVVTTARLTDRTLYRLRVVGLESREEAESTARKLEKEYDLQTLWVGKH